MNFTILKQARIGALAAAAIVFAAIGPLYDFGFAAGILATAVWGAAGFMVIEGLVRAALLPTGSERPRGRIALLVGGKLGLYGIAIWALLKGIVAPIPAMIGFSFLLVALVVATLWQRPRVGAVRTEEREER